MLFHIKIHRTNQINWLHRYINVILITGQEFMCFLKINAYLYYLIILRNYSDFY